MRNQLRVAWSMEVKKSDLGLALRRYRRYLMDLGFREQTIESYVFRAGKYLEYAKTDQPLAEDFVKFREILIDN